MADLAPEQLLDVVRSACARALEVDPSQVRRELLLVDALRTVGDVADRALALSATVSC